MSAGVLDSKTPMTIEPREDQVRILFADEYFLAIDKPAGLKIHPSATSDADEPSALKWVRNHVGKKVYPIHRLDQPTSGVLLFALDKKSAALAQQKFEKRTIAKSYLAVVEGLVRDNWINSDPLRSTGDGPWQEALTSFKRVLPSIAVQGKSLEIIHLSLLLAQPTTGRFHQIRRHLADRGNPVVGDFRYAGMARSFELCERLHLGTRMLLQAWRLELEHPVTTEPLRIEAPLDPLFTNLFPTLATGILEL